MGGDGVEVKKREESHSKELKKLAEKHWNRNDSKEVDHDLIDTVYSQYLTNENSHSNTTTLEFSGYLEKYLWTHFQNDTVSKPYLMSMVMMINEKFRNNITPWDLFKTKEEEFLSCIRSILALKCPMDKSKVACFSAFENKNYILFLINCFQSLEENLVSKSFLRLTSLKLWKHLSPERRELEFKKYPKLHRHWRNLEESSEEPPPLKKPRNCTRNTDVDVIDTFFFHLMIDEFLKVLCSFDDDDVSSSSAYLLLYLERFMELLVDLLSQLPTRRFLRIVLIDKHVVAYCRISSLYRSYGSYGSYQSEKGTVFRRLTDQLYFYQGFEINDQSGVRYTENEIQEQHYSKIHHLQRVAFQMYHHHHQQHQVLKDVSLLSAGSLSTKESLLHHFGSLEQDVLRELMKSIHLVTSLDEVDSTYSRDLLLEILIVSLEKRICQVDEISQLPMFPTEKILWGENVIPVAGDDTTTTTTTRVIAAADKVTGLPKLNLQFLTLHDYLLRSFQLFRLEAAYDIRYDIVDAIRQVNPRRGMKNETVFTGFSSMAVPLNKFHLVHVAPPKLGETKPAEVAAEIQYDLRAFNGNLRQEWDSLREHEVVFLVTLRATVDLAEEILGRNNKEEPSTMNYNDITFPEKFGVMAVRGAQVVKLQDFSGNEISISNNHPPPRGGGAGNGALGEKRILHVLLDSAQYQTDVLDGIDVYDTFNLLVRRRPKVNNFKAVLETIRDLMNMSTIGYAIPPWLHDIFLGYGDPAAASFRNLLPSKSDDSSKLYLDFVDTFLDETHLKESFSQEKDLVLSSSSNNNSTRNYYKVHHPLQSDGNVLEKIQGYEPSEEQLKKRNSVRFTPKQVEAIYSGMNAGLTMIVGPPGTGKTDVAVQIISNLYHNFPHHKIVVVTHANQALNDLFEKITKKNIDERHLLRLGSGERLLETEEDYSKWGRVNCTLSRRLELLNQVEKLSKCIGIREDGVAFTCENAEYFYVYHVQPKMDEFLVKCNATQQQQFQQPQQFQQQQPQQPQQVEAIFPFNSFFSTPPKDMEMAKKYMKDIKGIFDELKEYRPYELLRTQRNRGDFLLLKQARIIAMTCTHAALVRHRLVSLGIQYDTLIMEEAAQIIEVETLIPMLLQNSIEKEGCRLKRVVLLGDHHQLPPVIKNRTLQKYSHLDQSLFTRLVRLGVPTITLDQQGRSRSSLASLYRWRYKNLQDLPLLASKKELSLANAGFRYTFQFINVEDFNNQGEIQPRPFFYQNYGEAEYVVAMYQYMRLLGYPSKKITILSAYNGQKNLIREILRRRCSNSKFFEYPAKVTTIDRFQGQQNDYILLSLVRTSSIGHLRDIRRLIVAVSRARLGLYVFGRLNLLKHCQQLQPTIQQFLDKPSCLEIVTGEFFPSQRNENELQVHGKTVQNVQEMQVIVQQFMRHQTA